MRVAIAGAGAVGRSIASALVVTRNQVLMIESRRSNFDPELVPDADWMFADACELEALQRAGVDTCDVVIGATGDDKVNLVFAMLAKTELAVPRVVARVNDPNNAWMFTAAWGVDIAMSTPKTLAVAVEQAVTVGDVIKLMTLQQGGGIVVEVMLPPDSRLAGTELGALPLPSGAVAIAVLR
ncbi:MAG: TrkA family potassium uptake protein, partial [Actinomycetota bacterium]|nr:TrkA family potassium uptake protein [Actinomycetota bacterium]